MFATQPCVSPKRKLNLSVRVPLIALAFAAVAIPLCAQEIATSEHSLSVEFNRDVRPILSDRCFACHGPDGKQRQAELRLDTEVGLLGDADTPGVVSPGDPEDSELLLRMTSEDESERMPPLSSHKTVSQSEIQLIRRWIEQGASWQGHWSLEPLGRQPIPPGNDERSKHPVDAFVDFKLRQLSMSAAPPAEPRTLIRRLYLDLLGIPPTPGAVEAFVSEYSRDPSAYDRLVDSLLASPHFGERMAVWWLDLVRYADSVGYHGDQAISISPYRDYVIRSFNANKPFDQFTREQLAGDLLNDPSMEVAIATGYNRLGMMSAEGGVQDKEYLAKYIAERVRNVGGTWLGTTLGCCECHDHKFDPISQKEFYAFEAFFADIEEQGLYSGANDTGVWGPQIEVPTADQEKQRTLLLQQIAKAKAEFGANSETLNAERDVWQKQVTIWQTQRPETATSANGATLNIRDDGSIVASGQNPATDTYTLEFTHWPGGTRAIRLEVMPDDSLPGRGPGRADNGNFVLSEFHFEVVKKDGSVQSLGDAPLFSNATATYEQAAPANDHPSAKLGIASAIDGDRDSDEWGWAIGPANGQTQRAVFVLAAVPVLDEGDKLRVSLRQNFARNPRHTLGRFRIDATVLEADLTATNDPPRTLEELAQRPVEHLTLEQWEALELQFRSVAPSLAPIRAELDRLNTEYKKLKSEITTTLITRAREPRTIRVLHRGNWMDETGEVVQPATPAALRGTALPSDRRLSRLDLANWIASEENPLTARVFANRVWKLLFGAGLSVHVGDLGAQGDWPSHPELLDWLAAEFIRSKWDVKHLVKTIVTSQAYRRSSAVTAEELDRDPFNRWLARQGRWRLDAEFVRDSVLSVSALLDSRIGGRSVKPYQPAGYWAYLNFPQREWDTGNSPDIYRRGLYTHWQRQYLHPSLAAFDAPCREECTVDRPRSNTPLQALALLNDPSFVEAAKGLAQRIILEGGSDDSARLGWAISLVLTRPPREGEIDVLQSLLRKHRQEFAADEVSAKGLSEVGPFRASAPVSAAELAAWTSVSRVLLNLHEFINRE